MGDEAVRVGQLPARERVRREARVHERERRLRARVLQVGVVAEQLRGGEHALVDDRAARERRDHEVRAGGQLGHAADHVELALERVLVARELGRRGDDELLDVGREPVGGDADVVLLDRDVAPASRRAGPRPRPCRRAAARARRGARRPAAGSRRRRRSARPAAARRRSRRA